MTLEEQIELFTQKLVTKNNLPSWFHRTIKDLISKNVTIEEWNTFTQYISNNTSDIKSIEEFVLLLADYIEGYTTKDYVDGQDASTLQSAKDYADNKFETKVDAFSGNYNDLTNKPTIPVVPTNVSAFNNDAGYLTNVNWNQVSGKPTFATVATTGSYNDLTNKPTIPHLYQHNIVGMTTDTEDFVLFSFINTTSTPMTYGEVREWLYNNGFTGEGTNELRYLPATGRCSADSFEFDYTPPDQATTSDYCESVIVGVRATSEDDNEIKVLVSLLKEAHNTDSYEEDYMGIANSFTDTVVTLC